MLCNKCGEDKQKRGRTVIVYYGEVKGQQTKNYNTFTHSKTISKTYYRHIYDEAVTICSQCLNEHRKRKLMTLPLKWLIFFSPYIIISIIQKTWGALYVFAGIMLLVITYSAVSLMKKKHQQKPYKYDAYPWAKRMVKRRLKKSNPKARYTFWKEYPTNIKEVRY